eukprot:3522676-Karenia_brevis.AAC.1
MNHNANAEIRQLQQTERLATLIRQRQQLPQRSTAERKTISKEIQKEMKAIKRLERRTKIDNIIRQFQGLKQISGIKSRRDKTLITSMTTKDGDTATDRQSIADIFA